MVGCACWTAHRSLPLYRLLQPPELQYGQHAVEFRGSQNIRDELSRTVGDGNGMCRAGSRCGGRAPVNSTKIGLVGLVFTQVFEADGPLPPAQNACENRLLENLGRLENVSAQLALCC